MHIITGLLISALIGKKKKQQGAEGAHIHGFRGIAEVRHRLPGRMRLYAPILKTTSEAGRHLMQELSKARGVSSIQVSDISGTTLIQYDPEKVDESLIFTAVIHLLGLEKEIEERPESSVYL